MKLAAALSPDQQLSHGLPGRKGPESCGVLTKTTKPCGRSGLGQEKRSAQATIQPYDRSATLTWWLKVKARMIWVSRFAAYQHERQAISFQHQLDSKARVHARVEYDCNHEVATFVKRKKA